MISNGLVGDLNIILVLRQDGPLLEAWLRHHARIVPTRAIFVAVTGAVSAATQGVLDAARAIGVQVLPSTGGQAAVVAAQRLLATAGARADTDWFLLLRADEFLCATAGGQPVADAGLTSRWLDESRKAGRHVAEVRMGFENVPHSTGLYATPIAREAIRGSGGGAKPSDEYPVHAGQQETGFAVMRFRNRPFDQVLLDARQQLAGRLPDFRVASLRSYQGERQDLAYRLLQSPSEYLSSFPPIVADATALFDRIGLPVPFSSQLMPDEVRLGALRCPVNVAAYEGKLAMTREELELLFDEMLSVRHYLEFGAGGTTALACEIGIQRVTSIETSVEFCSSLLSERDLTKFVLTGRLRLVHVSLGETREWGYPVWPPSASQIDAYLAPIWQADGLEFALVDGRYRVACAAALYTATGGRVRLAVHDYTSRRHYKAVEAFLEPVRSAGDLTVFVGREGAQAEAARILAEYRNDPR